jgi:hypothetical protein
MHVVTLLLASTLLGNTVQVGPSRTYKTIPDGYNAAVAGDTIEIDAGDYPNTAFKIGKSNLTFKGVGGRPHVSYSGDIPNGKGIFVVEDPTVHDITFDNLEVSDATGGSGNEASIRFQGKNLTVRNCYLHHSYNGILEGHGAVSGSIVLIENTELAYNGRSGFEHNMYISPSVQELTVRYSYSHHVIEGHLLKSRALTNYIYANRIVDENWSGNGNQASALIDIPQGGRTYIIGNMLHKGDHPGNNTGSLWYSRENANNGVFELYVVNNTYVSDSGSTNTAFVLAKNVTNLFVANNIVIGPSAELLHFEDSVTRTITVTHNLLDTQVASITSSAGATVTNPPAVSDAKLVNRAGFDWHLAAGSAAIDAGADPGSAAGYGLSPTAQYVHKAAAETRGDVDVTDIGAFEYDNAGTLIPGGPPPVDPVDPVDPTDPTVPTDPTTPTGPTTPTTPTGPTNPTQPTQPTTGGNTAGNQTPGGSTATDVLDGSVSQSCSAAGSPSWLVFLSGLALLRRRSRLG